LSAIWPANSLPKRPAGIDWRRARPDEGHFTLAAVAARIELRASGNTPRRRPIAPGTRDMIGRG
jgi:hypothetical protein